MGSGKTVFAQGVALGLEVKEQVTSPSYTLIKEYQSGKLPLYHIDLYRISSDDSLWGLGLEEYLEGDGICVIEWARRVRDFLPESWLLINIEIMTDTKRTLHFESEGDHFQEILNEYRRLAFGF
jgi:tRNA threonylcarbamoyladenosine biosynthesis protein TsaE